MGWFSRLFKKDKAVVVEPPKDTKHSVLGTDEGKSSIRTVAVANDGVLDGVGMVYQYDEDEPLKEITPEVICVEDDRMKKESIKDVPPLDLMKVNFKGSPNKSKRKSGEEPLYIVLHHTGPGSFNGIVKWLCNKDAKASSHYVLGTGGRLTQLVNTKKQAWHAGRAKWGKSKDNSHSIGIEICNHGIMEKRADGFYYEQGRKMVKYTGKATPVKAKIVYSSGKVTLGYALPYPEKQQEKLVALCKALVKKYPAIARDNIVTHYQVAKPMGRKNDPFGLDVEAIKNLIFNG